MAFPKHRGCLSRNLLPVAMLLLAATLAAACQDGEEIILATTTSTQDSGLLDELLPRFERESGFRVKTIAVGSGHALRLGQEGEADVILSHSLEAELQFMRDGHGSERLRVMRNDFVIVGPAEDPADVRTALTAADAFARIASRRSLFISRGDGSGTHAAEVRVWLRAGIEPGGEWHQEIGQGMGATLAVANEKRAYTLSDRGTYLTLRHNLELQVLFQGDPELANIYHVIVVNAENRREVNQEGARALARYLVSQEVQEAIASFGADRFGEPLFVPDADQR